MDDFGIIEGRFIRHELNKYGDGLRGSVRRVQRSRGFSSAVWFRDTFSVGDSSLVYRFPRVQRFVDMKSRVYYKKKNGERVALGKGRKRAHPIYNKPSFGWRKYLVRSLSFGFSEEVRRQFQNLKEE